MKREERREAKKELLLGFVFMTVVFMFYYIGVNVL